MHSKRVNKYNSKNNMFGGGIQKEDEAQNNHKKAKLNEDVQTGSTYPYSNKDNGDQIRQFNNNEQPLMDITANTNLGMPMIEKEEDRYKSPKQNMKPPKTVASLFRNDSPEYAPKGGNSNMSSNEEERLNKKSDGTYYINNITNNIIVDKKHKDERNMHLLQSSGGGKKPREQ